MPFIKLESYTFVFHSDIVPLRNDDGALIEYNPANRYNNLKNLPLNKYGSNMFCRFDISDLPSSSGVYAIFIDEESTPKYIGKAANLASRWSRCNYASISPRNCYVGGQSTNCHINAEILKTYKGGHKIRLFIFETNNYSSVESSLIAFYDPEWNKQHPNSGQVLNCTSCSESIKRTKTITNSDEITARLNESLERSRNTRKSHIRHGANLLFLCGKNPAKCDVNTLIENWACQNNVNLVTVTADGKELRAVPYTYEYNDFMTCCWQTHILAPTSEQIDNMDKPNTVLFIKDIDEMTDKVYRRILFDFVGSRCLPDKREQTVAKEMTSVLFAVATCGKMPTRELREMTVNDAKDEFATIYVEDCINLIKK